jgi:uncharacterized protein YeaO (DUF488 family)
MAIHIVQLGSARNKGEGPRIGTVRRPPRGVKRIDYAKYDYFDVWLPQVAPSAALIGKLKAGQIGWSAFEKGYRRELSVPDNSRLLDVLSAFSKIASFSIGCYCDDEKKCHRSILRKILTERGASIR